MSRMVCGGVLKREIPPNHPFYIILLGLSIISHPFLGIPMAVETTTWAQGRCLDPQRRHGIGIGPTSLGMIS